MASKKLSSLEVQKEILRTVEELARRKYRFFCHRMYPQYQWEWFHLLVMDKIDQWVSGEVQKLAIFMPPQHAKSTLSSILNPAYILGKNPKAKVVCASYSGGVSSKFNRLAQDILDSEAYKNVFPDTRIPGDSKKIGNELRNSSYVETLGNKGFFKSVGVGGGLTSDTVEYGIIDDPIKDRKTANSPTYRDALWDWYIDVWRTRLNNDSRELMLFTRWHEDDLAGRLFDPENQHYSAQRAEGFQIIVLPALKENVPAQFDKVIDINDPREEGEALWESMHSKESHLEDKQNNPNTFASLKQQRPSPLEGALFKREWFEIISERELPFNPHDPESRPPVHFKIDGAFTDKTENDPSAHLAYYVHKGNCYIKHCGDMRKELNEYLNFIKPYMRAQDYDYRSKVAIEYKASGPGLGSMLRQEEHGSFNVQRISNLHVSWGKMTRGEYATPSLASGKVKLIQGPWNQRFLNQVCTFPNNAHDDMFDCLCYMVLDELNDAGRKVYKTKVTVKEKNS